MLNPFPIQFLALFAYTILRISVGLVFIYLGIRHINHKQYLSEVFTFKFFPYGTFFAWYLAVIELVIGLMFILGFLTQIAALLSILLCLKFLVMHKKFSSPFIPGRLVYFLIFAASLSLFITGAGFFAYDLPL